ncbi:hypothetical protein EKD00_08900 [Chlorobium phaeovibrioides]|nr:hypothetical protein EKD00_08900 [Chlorobium phaeovibrioides]
MGRRYVPACSVESELSPAIEGTRDSMPVHQYHYAVEKLSVAVECLATHPGDVRERLMAAFLGFHPLTEKDFPLELQADWRWVIKELSRCGPQLSHDGKARIGSFENTMKRIRKATGAKIAEKIYHLYRAVREYDLYRQAGP